MVLSRNLVNVFPQKTNNSGSAATMQFILSPKLSNALSKEGIQTVSVQST